MDQSPLVIALEDLLSELVKLKSENRTPKDRYIAIAITEAEKLMAFVKFYLE